MGPLTVCYFFETGLTPSTTVEKVNSDRNISGFEYPDEPFDKDELVTNDAVQPHTEGAAPRWSASATPTLARSASLRWRPRIATGLCTALEEITLLRVDVIGGVLGSRRRRRPSLYSPTFPHLVASITSGRGSPAIAARKPAP
jgi:hypothetical protein